MRPGGDAAADIFLSDRPFLVSTLVPFLRDTAGAYALMHKGRTELSTNVEEIEGVGPVLAGKLREAGIKTTHDLLNACAAAKGRRDVCTQTGIAEKQLLKWANMADLMRISGIGPEFSELLEAAGVDTVKELRGRNAENLALKLAEINEAKKLTRRVPSAAEVTRWIENAKTLDARITY